MKLRDLIKEGMSPEEWADAKEAERLAQHPEREKIQQLQQMTRSKQTPLEIISFKDNRTYYIEPEDIEDYINGEEVEATGDDGERQTATKENSDATPGQIDQDGVEEGTCGYGKKGKLGNKPAGPHLIKKSDLHERFQQLAGIKPLYEQGFDDRFKGAMSGAGFSDEEQDDIMSRDVGSPFPGTDSSGPSKASELIEKLREDYKSMSDEDLDTFSVEMVEHFLDNLSAQVRAKTILTTRGI